MIYQIQANIGLLFIIYTIKIKKLAIKLELLFALQIVLISDIIWAIIKWLFLLLGIAELALLNQV